ncbi:hypothetical protein RRG08_018890 [Elysia crispata]|uniref:Uncharacterized protein n=1 Tax=Elysia crispata TaxID=231223 RepID=A0AAE1DVH1_9GAST|nr:hypothetical protein RRG08_018890 [Elysia crispata]
MTRLFSSKVSVAQYPLHPNMMLQNQQMTGYKTGFNHHLDLAACDMSILAEAEISILLRFFSVSSGYIFRGHAVCVYVAYQELHRRSPRQNTQELAEQAESVSSSGPRESEGGLPRCTSLGLNPAITRNAADSSASFFRQTDCGCAIPCPPNLASFKSGNPESAPGCGEGNSLCNVMFRMMLHVYF